jgi:hypothetical protein
VQIVPGTLDTSYGKLRVDDLIWSPLTRRIKSQLCYEHSMGSKLLFDTLLRMAREDSAAREWRWRPRGQPASARWEK